MIGHIGQIGVELSLDFLIGLTQHVRFHRIQYEVRCIIHDALNDSEETLCTKAITFIEKYNFTQNSTNNLYTYIFKIEMHVLRRNMYVHHHRFGTNMAVAIDVQC